MKKNLATFILLLALLFMPTSSAQAQDPDDGGDVFLIGDNYTLESDETLNGSLALVGGNAIIEEDAVLNGDVILIGGNLTIDGDISGDVALIGGNLTISGTIDGNIAVVGGQAILTETAVVNGDISTIGGQVNQDPEAQVNGNIVDNSSTVEIPDVPGIPNIPAIPNTPDAPDTSGFNINPLWQVINVIWRALSVAAIGMLLTLFLQPQLERVGDAITHQPLMAGSFGLLALFVMPIALFIMTITIILIPVVIVVLIILPLAWLFGMIALGQEIGERFTRAISQTWAPVLSTGFGTFMLLLIGGFIALLPCIGWLITFLIGLIAFGGVVMTWFGTRSAPGSTSGILASQVEVSPAP